MSERFYSAAPITTERTTIDGQEAHHLLHVMRAAIGDEVTLFDNSGVEFRAVVEQSSRSAVELRIVDRIEVGRELPFALAVGVALPKGDRQKWLVEKLTELGVTKLVPLSTARGVAQPTDSALDRLRRAAIEAAKQSGRNRLLDVASPQDWREWIESHLLKFSGPQSDVELRLLLAHPGGDPISAFDLAVSRPTAITIGPEGGLTDDEVAAATAAGWNRVGLGPRILRVETAAVAIAAAVALHAS
jgi:16S rRNA (uracil1498-N3)-methyltransferase